MSIILKRKSLGVLLVGAIAGLTMGGVTAYWWLNEQRPLPPDLPFGSDSVPQDALMTVSLTTDGQQWQQLRQLGTPEAQDWVEQTLEGWGDRLFSLSGYDYQQDIAPWIGDEVTVVTLQRPLPSTPLPEDEPPLPNPPQERVYALLVPIADPVQAEATLNQFTTVAEGTPRSYKGVALRPLNGGGQWAAQLNAETLAIAAEPDTLERIIDASRGGNAMANVAGYRQAFERIVVPFPLARLYVNAPATQQMAIANSLKPIPLGGISPLHQNQGMAATVALRPDGLTIHGANWLPDDGNIRYPDSPELKRGPVGLPDDSLLMVAGSDFSQLWQRYQSGFDEDAAQNSLATPSFLERAIRATTGLTPDTDLLPWMEGEFSLAVVPTENDSDDAGLVFMVNASDREAAEAALTKLDKAVQDRYDFQVSPGTVNDTAVVNWASRFGALNLTRGWVDDTAFIAMGAIAPQLLPRANPTLADQPLFQATQPESLDGSNGRFFINLEQLLSRRGQIPLPSFPPAGEAVLNSMRAIGVTTAIESDRLSRYEVQVVLKAMTPAATSSRRATPSQILPPESFSTPMLPSAQ